MSRKKDIERVLDRLGHSHGVEAADEAIYDAGVIAGLRLAARLDHGLRKRASGHTGDWEDGHDLHAEACKQEAKRRAGRK